MDIGKREKKQNLKPLYTFLYIIANIKWAVFVDLYEKILHKLCKLLDRASHYIILDKAFDILHVY